MKFRRVALLALAIVTALAGCAQIPVSGPVEPGLDGVTTPSGGFLLPDAPSSGATPEEIVSGFLRAVAAGPEDDYAVARMYLTPRAGQQWDPGERVVVYPTNHKVEPTQQDDGMVRFHVPVSATVDSAGRYEQATDGASEDFAFSVITTAVGEWRIDSLDNGIVLPVVNFDFLYRPTTIYFISQDQQFYIPELRWFPARNQATSAAAAVLNGPSQWLRDAVYIPVPAGTKLAVDAVTVRSGTAVVELSNEARVATARARGLLAVQLTETLTRIPAIQRVELTVGDARYDLPALPELIRDPAPAGPLVTIDIPPRSPAPEPPVDGEDVPVAPPEDAPQHLQQLIGGGMEPIPGGQIPDVLITALAAPIRDGDPYVIGAGRQSLLALNGKNGAVELFEGTSLIAPSWDRFGWLWSGERKSDGELTALTASGETVGVSAKWLAGRTVRHIAVSRDGARIIVISAEDESVTVDIAAVIRDRGVPQALGDPVRIGPGLQNPTTVTWVDESQIAILADGSTTVGVTPFLLDIGGRSLSMPAIEDAKWLTAGRGERALYLGTGGGKLYVRNGQTWAAVAEEAFFPAFPG